MSSSSSPASTVDANSHDLTWINVALGLLFILLDAFLSLILGLDIGPALMIASARCIIQLSLLGLILERVFASDNLLAIFGIVMVFNILGAVEVTYNKSKRRFTNMFPLILCSLFCATLPISILGTQFAMAQHPFWQPDQYIPIVGMILGNSISAVGVGLNTVSKEFVENRDKVDTYLALGASRFEACKPLVVEAVKLALLPTMNQLSVIGIISIPGMMTGAIIGGKSVEQAARFQMIIMFMISASSALAVLLSVFFACRTLVDDHHRIRIDRMTSSIPAAYRWRNAIANGVWRRLLSCVPTRLAGGTRVIERDELKLGLLSGENGARP